MIALLCFVLAILASQFKSKSRLEAENAALRHQLIVLRRELRGRIGQTAYLGAAVPCQLNYGTGSTPLALALWFCKMLIVESSR